VAILGGTGDLGEGLALRLCAGREIIIGSRDPAKAAARAAEYASRPGCSEIRGTSNLEALELGDYAILAVPAATLLGLLDMIASRIRADALIISPVVPMSRGPRIPRARSINVGSIGPVGRRVRSP